MANYITIPTRVGDRTFDLDRPIVWQNRTFTPGEAREELTHLDERCYPLVHQVAEGRWTILVHSQENPHG